MSHNLFTCNNLSELTKVIFQNKNPSSTTIDIPLHLIGIDDAFKLFIFLTNVLSHGVFLFCGETTYIDNITKDTIDRINEKIIAIGIQIEQRAINRPSHINPNLVLIAKKDEGLKLEDYELHVISNSNIYIIKFVFTKNKAIECHKLARYIHN